MAASPQYKLYRDGEYIAAFKYVEDAAHSISDWGDHRDEIRYGHKLVVWREGQEKYPAANSFDFVAEIAHARIRAHYDATIGIDWRGGAA